MAQPKRVAFDSFLHSISLSLIPSIRRFCSLFKWWNKNASQPIFINLFCAFISIYIYFIRLYFIFIVFSCFFSFFFLFLAPFFSISFFGPFEAEKAHGLSSKFHSENRFQLPLWHMPFSYDSFWQWNQFCCCCFCSLSLSFSRVYFIVCWYFERVNVNEKHGYVNKIHMNKHKHTQRARERERERVCETHSLYLERAGHTIP